MTIVLFWKKLKIILEFKIKSTKIKEILHEISQEMDVPLEENSNLYSLDFGTGDPAGSFTALSFSNGLELLQSNIQLSNEFIIHFQKSTVQKIFFFFNLNGKITFNIEDKPENIEVNKYQNIILCIPANVSIKLIFHPKDMIAFNCLLLSQRCFTTSVDSEDNHWNRALHLLLENCIQDKGCYHQGNYNLKIADLYNEMVTFEKNGILKTLFMKAKSHEILVQHLLQYEWDLTEGFNSRYEKSDAAFIANAAKLLKSEITEIRTIKTLAERIGSNNNKLQAGFKRYYNQTINEYMMNVRMEQGRVLLINSDYNISEIVDKVGLNSKSYFSKIFRARYGMSPSSFRKENKEVKTCKSNSSF